MSYNKPIPRPVPLGQKCDFDCGADAIHWFKSSKRWCCSETVNGCPEYRKQIAETKRLTKLLKEKYPNLDLEYVKARYPYVVVDILDGTLRWNEEKECVEARCTYYECPTEWFEVPFGDLNFRNWALSPKDPNDLNSPTKGGDGYKYYCSDECRDLCDAFGKSGMILEKEITARHMVDWEEDDEWYGSSATQSQKNFWREVCLIRDEFLCVKCGAPAEHVHHIRSCKEVPIMEIDKDNGISTCIKCHYQHFHKRGTECSIPNIVKKTCYVIRNGVKKKIPKKRDGNLLPNSIHLF